MDSSHLLLPLLGLCLLCILVGIELVRQFARLLHRKPNAAAGFLVALLLHIALSIGFFALLPHGSDFGGVWLGLDGLMLGAVTTVWAFPGAARSMAL